MKTPAHAMRFLPVGTHAMLVELAGLDETLALFDAMQADPVAGVTELVPAARTLLVRFQPWVCCAAQVAAAICLRQGRPARARQGDLVQIPVRYDGADLAEMAAYLGLSIPALVQRHAAAIWTVAFVGFAPGFAYLSGNDPLFNVPRRASPRTRIPAGAVGLAGQFSAVYPRATPGGWQLIGQTDLPMWDLAQTPPARLQPGQRVQFVDVATEAGQQLQQQCQATTVAWTADVAAAKLPIRGEALQAGHATLLPDAVTGKEVCQVVATGLQALWQDGGRPGLASQGVSASGALDRGAFHLANRLVGNGPDAAVIELLGGGFSIQLREHAVVAVTGAAGALNLQDRTGRPIPASRYRALMLEPGDCLTVANPSQGLRSYLAMRGGFSPQPVMGSCATDTLSGVGPDPLQPGQILRVGRRIRGAVEMAESEGMAALHLPSPSLAPSSNSLASAGRSPSALHGVVLEIMLGPRTDWIDDASVQLLQSQCWQVTTSSNRVGLRLQGEMPLRRAAQYLGRELPSEGTVAGSLQVPANGQPVLFLADHPLTGGYPVVGCVAAHHLDLAAQLPPGTAVRFRVIAPFVEIVPA